MTNNEILNLTIDNYDFPEDMTIKGYLEELLITLWKEGEQFSGKRPFGNGGWEHDLYRPLVNNNVIEGSINKYNELNDFDYKKADKLIEELIKEAFKIKKEK